MRFKKLDLNLLVTLDVLLTERGVSSAAKRLNLSQPAVSGALLRLREYFEDDLLIQSGRSMLRTSFAESIADPLKELLVEIENTVGMNARFDPHTSKRKFTIISTDYVTELLLTDVVREISQNAPNVMMTLLNITLEHPELSIRSGSADLSIIHEEIASNDMPAEYVFEDEFAVVGDLNNPILSESISIEDFMTCESVLVRYQNRYPSIGDAEARKHFSQRVSHVVAPTFVSVPGLIVGTKRIALIQRKLALKFAKIIPLKVVDAPFASTPFKQVMQFSEVRERDAGLRWLRSVVIDCARQL